MLNLNFELSILFVNLELSVFVLWPVVPNNVQKLSSSRKFFHQMLLKTHNCTNLTKFYIFFQYRTLGILF